MSYLAVVNDPDGPCVFGAQLTIRRHWVRVNGPFPKGPGSRGKLQLNHTCDQPFCRNLGHVWLGTQSQNMIDASTKGRLLRRNHPSVLTRTQVKAIRLLLTDGKHTQAAIGRRFGVAQITISNIATGRSWSI